MQSQQANGGVMYLKGDSLSKDACTKAGLTATGPGFCLAGSVSVVSEVRAARTSLRRCSLPCFVCSPSSESVMQARN